MRRACYKHNCDRVVHARGLCKMHYQRAARAGELPDIVAAIPVGMYNDDDSVRHRTGVVDAHANRPHRSRRRAYLAGYDEGLAALPVLPRRARTITVSVAVDDLLTARRALWQAGEHEAAVRVLAAYAMARTTAGHQAVA